MKQTRKTGCCHTTFKPGDQKLMPARKTNVISVETTIFIKINELRRSFPPSPAFGRYRITAMPSPISESTLISDTAAMAAELMPTASVEKSLAATVKVIKPIRLLENEPNINKYEFLYSEFDKWSFNRDLN